MKRSEYIFYGDMRAGPDNPHKDTPKESEPYLAAPALVEAVNLAIFLGRPLLLEGEAGCGKTRLAHAVAYELGLPLYRWDVRSTSKAQEGLYTYDAIRRLHDAQVKHFLQAQSNAQVEKDPTKPEDYVTMGPLGKAFEIQDRPAVVLIDEIDKADIDFPNDLLTVLDEPWEFTINETNTKVTADPEYRPIVIITSNREKGNLPAPFLRRCIYQYLTFPEDEQLKEIVETHFEKCGEHVPEITDLAVKRFRTLRIEGKLHKKPGTSEFLDWLTALHGFSHPMSQSVKLTDNEKDTFPYPGLLFKLRADWQNFAGQQ